MKVGVSPAYFLSKFGEHFTVDEIVNEVPVLKKMGFTSLQLEITHFEHLNDWDDNALTRLRETCLEYGVSVSQLVVHFWIDAFADCAAIEQGIDDYQIVRCIEIAKKLESCDVITVPFGRFHLAFGEFISPESYYRIEQNLLNTLRKLCSIADEEHLRIAMELQPGAIIAGIAGALRIMKMLGSPSNLGYNFDTGHANAMREIVELIPSRLGSYLFGTHVCDNDGSSNCSLPPGDGAIDWPKVIASLKGCGYDGPYDLEIMCSPQEVKQQYLEGKKNFLIFMET